MDKKYIKTPEPRKIVDKNNNVIDMPVPVMDAAQAANTASIIASLRDMADKVESGEIKAPEFVVVMPKFMDGEIPLFVLGAPIPLVMLEGLMHKVLTRMAMS